MRQHVTISPDTAEAVLTSVDGGTSSSHVSLLPVTGEDRRALDTTNFQPAIDEHNAGCYPPPHLPKRKREPREVDCGQGGGGVESIYKPH